MNGQKERRVIEWGHLALLAIIATVVVAYLLDARATSLKTNNLLLVQPAAFLALVLIAAILPQIVSRIPDEEVPNAAEKRTRLIEVGRVALLAAAFGLFVFSLETVGFDLATLCFIAAGLFICGERRIWVIGLFSALFTLVVVYSYQQLVPYPFPMAFF